MGRIDVKGEGGREGGAGGSRGRGETKPESKK